MSVKATVAVGAQYVSDSVRLTVLQAGADEAGAWAFVLAGGFPGAERVQLRVGEPHRLRDGWTVCLVAVAPPPHPPVVALEITTATDAAHA